MLGFGGSFDSILGRPSATSPQAILAIGPTPPCSTGLTVDHLDVIITAIALDNAHYDATMIYVHDA